MKYFVIGDVHGFYDEMIAALNKAGFNPEDPNHTLISLGDNFDRGPKPLQVMRYLQNLKRKELIRGNHEDLLMECLRTRMYNTYDVSNKTVETIAILSNRSVSLTKMVFEEACADVWETGVADFIRRMKNYFETEHYVFVHGWIPLRKPERQFDWDQETVDWDSVLHGDKIYDKYNPNWRFNATALEWDNARWTKSPQAYYQGLMEPGKTIVCGHWNTYEFNVRFLGEQSHEIFRGNGVIAIDGTVALTKNVNVLIVED